MFGVKPSKIQDIERGRSAPSEAFLGQIKDRFGEDLLASRDPGHGEPQKPPATGGGGKTAAQFAVAGADLTHDPRVEAFGVRYRRSAKLVDEVLAEVGFTPTKLLRESLKAVVFAHGVSQENVALLITGIEQQIKEAKT